MIKKFKFFQKEPERHFSDWLDSMDDYFLGGITQRPVVQFRMSRRHYNILPERVRNMEEVHMLAYIQGWQSVDYLYVINPYTNDLELRILWEEGRQHRLSRMR